LRNAALRLLVATYMAGMCALSILATACAGLPEGEAGGSTASPPPPAREAPKVGDLAPPFLLPGSDGKTYRLADYKGKQAVVLAWFAKAFTSG